SIFLGIIIILFSIIAYVGLGFILGTQLARRIEDVNALVAAFGVPLLILGGAFLPTSLFPQTLLNIARFNPIYHMNEALLGVWAKGANFHDIILHLWFLFWFAMIMLACGWVSYQRMLMVERKL
ncbi:MAG: ABC transporter permease, partial [Sphaerospermopsis kisseleviana]